jgi:hypothetical protein
MSLTVAELCWALNKTQHSVEEWVNHWRNHGVSEIRIRNLLIPHRVYREDGAPMGVRYLNKSGEWGACLRERGSFQYIGQYATEAEAIQARYQYIVSKYGAGAIVGRPPEES